MQRQSRTMELQMQHRLNELTRARDRIGMATTTAVEAVGVGAAPACMRLILKEMDLAPEAGRRIDLLYLIHSIVQVPHWPHLRAICTPSVCHLCHLPAICVPSCRKASLLSPLLLWHSREVWVPLWPWASERCGLPPEVAAMLACMQCHCSSFA